MSDSNTKGGMVDPIEYGRLLHAVESIAKQMERWPQLETGLQKANEDIRFLKHSQSETDRKLNELITAVKHLNGCDEKLRTLGFRLEDAAQHRADLEHLRQSRIAAEKSNSRLETVKARVMASLALAGTIWILSTLWAARHTLAG